MNFLLLGGALLPLYKPVAVKTMNNGFAVSAEKFTAFAMFSADIRAVFTAPYR